MKGLEVEMEQLRQLGVALVGREEVGCSSGSGGGGGGAVDDKVGEGDEKDAREISHQPGRRLRVCARNVLLLHCLIEQVFLKA